MCGVCVRACVYICIAIKSILIVTKKKSILIARLVGGNEGEGMGLELDSISIHGLVGGIPLKWDSQSHLSGNVLIPPHPLVLLLAIH